MKTAEKYPNIKDEMRVIQPAKSEKAKQHLHMEYKQPLLLMAEMEIPEEEQASLVCKISVRQMEQEVRGNNIETASFGNRIWLVGGSTLFNGKIDHFAGSVPGDMREKLLQGESFAFCNAARDQLCLLKWDGYRFNMLYIRAESSTFPWPRGCEKGTVIEVTSDTFRAMLLLPSLLKQKNGEDAVGNEEHTNTQEMILY